jgi:hypothetical protein
MKEFTINDVTPLTKRDQANTFGGVYPPTPEQLEELREQYGILADIICF